VWKEGAKILSTEKLECSGKTGAIGGRKQGRSWPGNGPKSHRNAKEDISQTVLTHHQGHFSS